MTLEPKLKIRKLFYKWTLPMNRRRKVLSIDWDGITGDSTSYCTPCGSCGWACSKGQKVSRGILSRAHAGRERQLIVEDILKSIVPVKKFYVAECHASLYFKLQERDHILTIDAHNDDWEDTTLHCGSWIFWAINKKDCIDERVDLPASNPFPERFCDMDIVFLCKSSPWTPKKLDNEFNRFIRGIGEVAKCEPTFIGHKARELKREYENFRRKLSGRELSRPIESVCQVG